MSNEAVNAVMHEYERLFEEQDASGIAALYAEDARYLPPNASAVEGRAAIQQAIQHSFEAGWRTLRLRTVRLDVVDDLAIKQGAFEATLAAAAGTVTVVGKDIEVLRRQPGGSWRFVGDIFNLDAPFRP